MYTHDLQGASLKARKTTNYVGANGRVDNAKTLAAMLQENTPDATCWSIPGTICTWYMAADILLLNSCDVYVSLEVVITELSSRMTKRYGHWVCWMSMGAKRREFVRVLQ